MSKRIVIDLADNPALNDMEMAELVYNISFAVQAFLDIQEYTMKVESE